jgi:hypothetical protein
MNDAVIFPGSNEVRCCFSLKLLGHYFIVDGVRYFVDLKKNSKI